MRLRLLVAACLMLGVVSIASAAPAEAALKSIWGPTQRDGRSAFPMYKRLGVDVLQLQLRWASVAPTRPENPRDPNDPAYEWPTYLGYAVKQGRRHGVRILAMVITAPGWANGGKPPTWAPKRPRDYADFIYAASQKYRRIGHWMVWGEPSRKEAFNPLPPNSPEGPRLYARILDRAYGALKKSDRRDKVIGGNTFTVGDVYPGDWIRWMRLPNGEPPRLDWFGHNPFTARFPDLKKDRMCGTCRDFSDIDLYIREVRRAYRKIGRKPKLWLSEWTIQSDHGSNTFYFYVTREDQARWIRRGYAIARRKRYVAGLGWFQLQDSPDPGGGASRNWGLLTVGGDEKPSYRAYRKARARKKRSRRR